MQRKKSQWLGVPSLDGMIRGGQARLQKFGLVLPNTMEYDFSVMFNYVSGYLNICLA